MFGGEADAQQQRFLQIAQTCAGFNVRRVSRAVTQHFDLALAPLGLRATQFTLLGALVAAGPCSLGELAEGLLMDRTSLTRNVRPLMSRGLLQVGRGPDRRVRRVEITERGRQVVHEALPAWERAQAAIVTPLGQERWAGLVGELRNLAQIVQAQLPPAN
ncbi:MAG: MarR family winged helix-turn-helix transcriptional regulator [Chloroflexota bacterium]